MNKIRIIIVDDHQLIRDGLKALLSGFDDIEIIAEAGSAEEFLQKLKSVAADVVLIDISLPGMSGIRLTEQLSTLTPVLKVLILSMHLNEEYISSALKAGALGYLAKNTTRDELITAIRSVASGKKYLGREVSDVITSGYIRRIKVDDALEKELLSKREIEILKLIAEGLGNKEISEKLFISIRTVESHKNHIMQKLGFRSLVEMVRYAIKRGLINL
jgi:DNA-binding NarL/FixJ family response regulator